MSSQVGWVEARERSIVPGQAPAHLLQAKGRRLRGECKGRLSLRVRQEFRRELEEATAKDRRTLGNFGELLLE